MRSLLVLGAFSVLAFLAAGCEAVERIPGSIASATTPSAAIAATPPAGATPSPSPSPSRSPSASPVATAAPGLTPTASPSAVVWRSVPLRPETTNGGADIAVGGDGRVHVVTSNLEDSWGPFWYDDASVYTSTSGGAGKLRKGALVGGTSPLVAAHGRDVWIVHHAYACGARRYGDIGGVALDHSADAGRTWEGSRCLTWGRNRPWDQDAGSPRAIAAARGVVYVVGSQRRRDLTVWASRDGGATWSSTLLAQKPGIGCCVAAAAGDRAVIAWASGGKVKARTSTDAGRTWSKAKVLPLANLRGAAGREGRIALWGGDASATTMLTWANRRGWASHQLPDAAWAGTEPDGEGYTGSLLVALGPDRQVAILGSGAGCTYDEEEDTATGSSTWQWSPDNGATWSDPIAVAGCPSPWESELVIDDDGRPYVLEEDDWGYELLIGPRTRWRA